MENLTNTEDWFEVGISDITDLDAIRCNSCGEVCGEDAIMIEGYIFCGFACGEDYGWRCV